VAALSLVETDFLDRIQELSKNDDAYLKLVDLVKQGIVRRYCLEDDLLPRAIDYMFLLVPFDVSY
jgi:hypothetical protein